MFFGLMKIFRREYITLCLLLALDVSSLYGVLMDGADAQSPDRVQFSQSDCNQWTTHISGRRWKGCCSSALGLDFAFVFEPIDGVRALQLVSTSHWSNESERLYLLQTSS